LLPADGGSIALITQLMERGSLYHVLHDASAQAVRPTSTAEKLRLALDIAEGLAYLHNNRVVHRDMKSGNVLVDGDGRAKIADFGLAAYNDHTKSYVTGVIGTYAWAAPESMNEGTMKASADIYSLGVVLWELFTGCKPWEGLTPMQIMNRVYNQKDRLPLPASLTRDLPAVSALIAACFSEDEALRPTADAVQAALKDELDRLPRGLDEGAVAHALNAIRVDISRVGV
jgi:serine/threonine protein kinase